FKQFVNETGYKTRAEADGKGTMCLYGGGAQNPKYVWSNPKFAPGDDYAVGCLAWNDTIPFCEWLSKKENKRYRLPTEAEWEWACRAGSMSKFFFGDDENKFGEYARMHGSIHPVGTKKPNPWGLFDLYDAQFCYDWLFPYPTGTEADPRGPEEGRFRVIRGRDSADRFNGSPDYRMCHFGFRVVCEDVSP